MLEIACDWSGDCPNKMECVGQAQRSVEKNTFRNGMTSILYQSWQLNLSLSFASTEISVWTSKNIFLKHNFSCTFGTPNGMVTSFFYLKNQQCALQKSSPHGFR